MGEVWLYLRCPYQADTLPDDFPEAASFPSEWRDIRQHLHKMPEHFALRSTVYAALEGSNRPQGKHKGENTYQDVGLHKPTALGMGADSTRLKDHDYVALFAMKIDSLNIEMNIKKKHIYPKYNAYRQYQGRRNWIKRELRGNRATALEVVLSDALTNPTSRFYHKIRKEKRK